MAAIVSAACVILGGGGLLVGVVQISEGNIAVGILCIFVFLVAAYFLHFTLERHYGND